MKTFLTSLAIITLVAVAGFRIMSPGGLMGFKYESTAVVQIHPSMLAIAPSTGSPTTGTLITRNYMVNEFETITSNATLDSAIEAIALDQRWALSREETLKKVKTMVSVEPRRGTDFIEIKARSHNQEDAHDIVNAVADSYIARRNKMEVDRAKKALEALDTELQKHGDVVNDKQKALTVLIQSYGIPYFDGRSSSPVGQTRGIYQNAQQRLDQLEQDRDRLEIQIDQLIKTSAEEMIPTAAAIKLPENQVSILYTQYLETLRESEKLAAQGLAEDHPARVALTTQANEFIGDAREAVISLKDVLNTRVDLIDRQLERMKETVLNEKETSVDLSRRQHDYNSAKENYEQSRDLHREIKISQQEQRILLRNPPPMATRHE
jgi:uncharacterized protein involved in exopolysaccharide biosynthesis